MRLGRKNFHKTRQNKIFQKFLFYKRRLRKSFDETRLRRIDGFRPSRSCVTQLLQLVHEWFQVLEKLGSVESSIFFHPFAAKLNLTRSSRPSSSLSILHLSVVVVSCVLSFFPTQFVLINGNESHLFDFVFYHRLLD